MDLSYFTILHQALILTEITARLGHKHPQFYPVDKEVAWKDIRREIIRVRDYQHKLCFVGNGGSASICTHMAVDFQKRAGVPSLSFHDGSMLTCLGNDYGFDSVFDAQLKYHLKHQDIVFAISSSGNSDNIINAAKRAVDNQAMVITFTGFKPENKLRSMGALNFYVPSDIYGIVEIAHLTILHALADSLIDKVEIK